MYTNINNLRIHCRLPVWADLLLIAMELWHRLGLPLEDSTIVRQIDLVLRHSRFRIGDGAWRPFNSRLIHRS